MPREPSQARNLTIQPIEWPSISIVIPSYNQGPFLAQCIQSALNQGYPNLELIIVDGGSTDQSIEIIKNFSDKLTWWISEPDAGQAHAINKGMEKSSGDILAWLNSDDCLTPNSLFRVAMLLTNNPEVDVVYSHRILIDESGNDIGKWIIPPHNNFVLSYVDFVPQETMFWRKSLWASTGSYIDESFQFALDWELIHRFIEAGAVFYRAPAFLGMFRVHDKQKTKVNMHRVGHEEMERIRERAITKLAQNRVQAVACRFLQKIALGWYLLQARFIEILWYARISKIE